MSCTLNLLSDTGAYYDTASNVEGRGSRATFTKVLTVSILAATFGFCGGFVVARARSSATDLVATPSSIVSRPAVVGGLVGAASTPLSATAAESGPAHMIASLHQAPLAKIGFVVKDAPKLDIPDDVLLGYILAAALPLFAVGFWIYSGAAARAEGVGGAADYGVSGIYKVDGKIPTNPAAWKIQSEALQARGIKDGMTGEELVSLFKKGKVIIVDVRGSDKFARGGIKGSVNVQMFRRIEGWTPLKAARRFQFALFGQVGTEFNPNFLEEFETKVPKNTQVVFVDDSSMGTLKPSQAFPNGKCSHALMAAYLTGVNGYERTKMQFLEGGIDLYARAGGEIDGTIEPPFMRT